MEPLLITHQELLRAIQLDKPRWLLAHENVVNARRLLLDLGFDQAKRSSLVLSKNGAVIDDLRLIDMYESATMEGISIADRVSSWVQKYRTEQDVLQYAITQFSSPDIVRGFLKDYGKKDNA